MTSERRPSSTTPHYTNTTRYYPVLQNTFPELLCTTKYYSSTTPYYKVQKLPKRAFRARLPKRAFRARLPQLFKRQASKTSISCEPSANFQGISSQKCISYEASSTFQSRSCQNLAPATQNAKITFHLEGLKRQSEYFVFHTFNSKIDDFAQTFLIRPFLQSSKNMFFCEASATFQDNHQILPLPRYLQ